MDVSMRWLSDYVTIDTTPKEFSSKMTMSGSKVEGYEVEGSEVSGVVVGKVLSIEKHPDADKLFVCKIDVGSGDPLQIITAATNVVAGAVVPVVLDGGTLVGGKTIQKGMMRGLESNGMLCSLEELGLTDHDFPYADENGIFLLEDEEAKAPLGSDIHEALGLNDISVEFEITPNRPDCQSMIGIAREAAATYDVPLTLPKPEVKGSGDDIHNHISIQVENPELCPRYTARVVKNVRIKPSPRWMRERLRACGVRPINNIVDITNFVMLEYGQPMHAFDLKHVGGGKIIVRNAKPGEEITTLDGQHRILSPEMLLICDDKEPTGIAGVMGGEYSSIMDDTNTIVFESANFNGTSIRLTSKKLGMRTEASGRYEKGLDPQITMDAVQRACQLVELLDAGDVVDGIIDIDNSPREQRQIKLEVEWINGLLGIDITREEMVDILVKLGFTMDGDMVLVPSWRADCEHKADLSEEIARFYGYDTIPSTVMNGVATGRVTPRQKLERKIIASLLGQGLSEIITYSFVSPKYYDNIRLPADSKLRDCVVIANPLGEDTSVMRTTVVPSMLEVLTRNYNYRNPSAALFEMGTEYIPVEGQELPDENLKVSIGMYGENEDFFSLKGVLETLLESLHIKDFEVVARTDDPTFHPGRCAVLMVGGKEAGVFGEVHPAVQKNYGLSTRCYVANLDVDTIEAAYTDELTYTPLPRYPAVERDIALLCDEALTVAEMEKAIKSAGGEILESVALFDVYRGSQIPEGKKSVAFSLQLRHSERTLTDEEADTFVTAALAELAKLGATLRAG